MRKLLFKFSHSFRFIITSTLLLFSTMSYSHYLFDLKWWFNTILVPLAISFNIVSGQFLSTENKVQEVDYPYSIYKTSDKILEIKASDDLGEHLKSNFDNPSVSYADVSLCMKQEGKESECYKTYLKQAKAFTDFHNGKLYRKEKSHFHHCQEFCPSCIVIDDSITEIASLTGNSIDDVLSEQLLDLYPKILDLNVSQCSGEGRISTFLDYFCGYSEEAHGTWTIVEFFGRVWRIDLRTNFQCDHLCKETKSGRCCIRGCDPCSDDRGIQHW